MKTVLVALLLVAGVTLIAMPAATAASYPCTNLAMPCPALFCKAYEPRTGYRSGCVGEPVQCVTDPCPYWIPLP